METRKLYYENCRLVDFSARVLACDETSEGWLIELDETAFYPEGGGQAADTGTLSGRKILHVREEEEAVLHLCDGPLAVGGAVDGHVDYAHRFDLMQQHTGEHILSGLVYAKYGWHNTGFHIGADSVVVDFDGEVPAEDLAELEQKLNRAIWEDVPLKIWTPSPEELPTVFYRTKRALPWPVRIVQIPGYDSCACCGIQVERTGEVGLAKILSCVRFRGGSRMELLCGARALDYLTRSHEQNLQVSRAFSAPLMETGEAARKMNDTLGQMKYQIAGLESRIFAAIARDCRDRGDVCLFHPGLDSTGVRKLADLVADTCGGTAAVFSGSDETGYACCLVTRSGDLKAFGKTMFTALGGRGGGRPQFQQGSVSASRTAIGAYFSGAYIPAAE